MEWLHRRHLRSWIPPNHHSPYYVNIGLTGHSPRRRFFPAIWFTSPVQVNHISWGLAVTKLCLIQITFREADWSKTTVFLAYLGCFCFFLFFHFVLLTWPFPISSFGFSFHHAQTGFILCCLSFPTWPSVGLLVTPNEYLSPATIFSGCYLFTQAWSTTSWPLLCS